MDVNDLRAVATVVCFAIFIGNNRFDTIEKQCSKVYHLLFASHESVVQ